MSPVAARRIRRVLVALDASPGSVAAAAAAARLAAALDAELAGLFVEDYELLAISRSPHARQVRFLTATVEPVGAEQMERQLRAQAARARRALSRLASREGITFTFTVARGRVAGEILAAAASDDLISVGRGGWSRGHRRRLGSTARALLERRQANTLVTDREAAPVSPLVVLFDGSEVAEDALGLATRLAGPAGGGLVVLATSHETARQAADRLGERASEAHLRRLPGPAAEALPRLVEQHRAGLLVLPVGGPGLTGDALSDLLTELSCAVLVVS